MNTLCFFKFLNQTDRCKNQFRVTNQVPAMRDKVMKAMLKKESLLVRKKTIPRVIDKIMDFINTFIDGIAA